MKKKKALTAFDEYVQSMPEWDRDKLSSFFWELDRHNALIRSERVKLRADFENALLCYRDVGVSLETALKRLSITNLGGFYARPPIMWYALDDAAKIYPLSMRKGQMAMFRLSVYLREPVLPELLQMALSFTIKRFPSFATTVKKGVFWHYLDTSKRRYTVEREDDIPCRPLMIAESGSQSFRVLYYNNRISAEFFHILTDGTGGMTFLKALLSEYLRLLGVEATSGDIPDVNAVPDAEETTNEFPRTELRDRASGFVDKPAVQMSGRLSETRPCCIVHFKLSATRLREVARGKGATVTEYALSRIFTAALAATDEKNGDINIQVPVNMRRFYPSKTLKNFSMYCGIRLPIREIADADSMLGEISRQLREKTSKDAMDEMTTATSRLVNAVRYIPLFIKAPVASIVYGFLGEKVFSSTFSNLGVVSLPTELSEYVESMDFVLGTARVNRASCSMVTVGDIATLTVAKLTADPTFEETLNRLLIEDGLSPVTEGSGLYEG